MLSLVWGNFTHHCIAAFFWIAVRECQWSDSSNFLNSSSDLLLLPAVSPRDNFHLLLHGDIAAGVAEWQASSSCADKTGSDVPQRMWRQMLEWAAHPRTAPMSNKAKIHQTPTTRPQLWWNSELLHRTCRLKHNWAAFGKFIKLCQGMVIF